MMIQSSYNIHEAIIISLDIENIIDRQNMHRNKQDGWEQLSHSSSESLQPLNLQKHPQARSILEHQYSLEPDMATGWTPKLPSCPIPLTYQNALITSVLQKIEPDPRYRIVYRGPRHINSVQLHKTHNYRWKYRQKYEVKVNAITEAVAKIGKNEPGNDQPWTPPSPQSDLQFDSEFQSGNLDLVIRVKPFEYDCFIRSDTNTRGHTNWYYFTIHNHRFTGEAQLNICNIAKVKNLYNKGMTPYSRNNDPESEEHEWKQNRCYDTQFVQRLSRYIPDRVEHQLQFKYHFRHPHCSVSFAYAIPYTYSQLQTYIQSIKTHKCVISSTLCESFTGLELPLLTITSPQRIPKTHFLVAARIHPGETNSSHLLEGLINSLLSSTPTAEKILERTCFHIIPMLNPDGVAAGNYRTSLSGRDLNRQFHDLQNPLFPEIQALSALAKRLKAQRRKPEFFLDLHSHSSRTDFFCYGPEHPVSSSYYTKTKLLSQLLQRHPIFSPQQCLYQISPHKQHTARAYMLRNMSIPMTYTFEVSNGLQTNRTHQYSQIDANTLKQAGKAVTQTLSEYLQFYNKVQTPMTANKIKEERSSLLNFSASTHIRKSLRLAKSQDIERPPSSHILGDYPPPARQQQTYSDSQDSADDINDQQLHDLFAQRLQPQSIGLTEGQSQLREKVSLRVIRSKKQLTKNQQQFSQNKENLTRTPTAKPHKTRIYYEETHPRASKRIYENPYESKKPIKQKRFPILF